MVLRTLIVSRQPPDHRTQGNNGIGQRLKLARQRSGLTIRELGAAGVASLVMADTEHEKRTPRADTVERLAGVLKVTACWLA